MNKKKEEESMKKTSLLLALTSFVLPLMSCNSSRSFPKAVFNEFKDQVTLSLGSPNAVIYGDVCYAYITGSGTKDPGDKLGNIYYQIPYHYNITGVPNYMYTAYAVYYSSSNTLVESSDRYQAYLTYTNVLECIKDKTYKGVVGIL